MKNLQKPLGVCLILVYGTMARSDDKDKLGLKVPAGFEISVYADESVANDTYAMTLDSRGQVVVSTRGVIKTLHANPKTGKADRFTIFAKTETGAMGLCFDGNDLLYCGDGWFSRFRDMDGDGQADGPAQRIAPLTFTEHGGHAIRKGPDGSWYVIGGNDSGIGPALASQGSPVRAPEAGALLRFSADLGRSEIIAHGFRNPYDFDFNASGDIFTYDSDVERDIFLPWYAQTRIYHVAIGGHHGWRLTGYLRSWPRPDYDPGTVNILTNIGRGSPTGVVCYRHQKFPEHYRGGVFALDWTFGKIYYLRPTPLGASYQTSAEVFLEPIGSSGFAPTDAEVAPDGSLLVSVGGRGTRGLVYRIEYRGETSIEKAPESDAMTRVLRSPQPLDAWSRARWQPEADRLGKEAFLATLTDDRRSIQERVRAVEILTERYEGLTSGLALELSRSTIPELRARVAWSLGRVQSDHRAEILETLAIDKNQRVRRDALDAFGSIEPQASVLISNLGHADKRVRLSAIQRAVIMPEPSWQSVKKRLEGASLQAKLAGLSADIERSPRVSIHGAIILSLLDILRLTTDPKLRLQVVRLIQRALGDYHLKDPAVEVLTGYSTQSDLSEIQGLRIEILKGLHPIFPSRSELLDDEIARLLAMLEDDDATTASAIPRFWTKTSSATRDLHFLIVFARLRARRTAAETSAVASALAALDGKLSGQEQRAKQSWNLRVGELETLLLKQDQTLGEALLRDPRFIDANHASLALALPPDDQKVAARAFLKALDKVADDAWSGPLIDLLAILPASESRPIFREQWVNRGLRDALLPKLAEKPEEVDRSRFLDALESSQPEIVRQALKSLGDLPADPDGDRLASLVQLLRRLTLEPKEKALRAQTLSIISRQADVVFPIEEGGGNSAQLRINYEPVFTWFTQKYPEVAKRTLSAGEDPRSWAERLSKIDWNEGDAKRGATLFQNRGCSTCHSGSRALGPSLAGVTSRLSRNDLFNAIVSPNLDVAPAYRISQIETRDGRITSGMIAFESADGLIVQTGATTTVRIPNSDIASRHVSTRSLMPDQLLQGLTNSDLADLDAYLRKIPSR